MRDAIFFAVGAGLVSASFFALGDEYARRTIMQQAHERGYAVECVGQTGYHWECEE